METSNQKCGCKEDAILKGIYAGKYSFQKVELKYGIPKSTLKCMVMYMCLAHAHAMHVSGLVCDT